MVRRVDRVNGHGYGYGGLCRRKMWRCVARLYSVSHLKRVLGDKGEPVLYAVPVWGDVRLALQDLDIRGLLSPIVKPQDPNICEVFWWTEWEKCAPKGSFLEWVVWGQINRRNQQGVF